MSAVFAISTLFGLMVLFTSIGGDAVGLGVAAVLILVGSIGKAWLDNRTQSRVREKADELRELIAENHADINEQLADLSRSMKVLGGRIEELEAVVTAPSPRDI